MKKVYYIFFLLVLLMIGLSILEIYSFKNTKEKIKTDILNELVLDVDSLAKNIAHHLEYYSLKKLKNEQSLKDNIDNYLKSFVTNNYKNVFIVYPKQNTQFFVVLADGSKKDKFDFKETFEPLQKKYWEEVINTKKPIYFQQKIKDIWMSFLYPVVKNNELKYIIVIDFSTKPLMLVNRNLEMFKSNVILFSGVIFISIIILLVFLIYDYTRQHKMQHLIQELKELNDTLEDRVKEEVAKNREKDNQLVLQSRLALMGELLSMIAHQWRQPLNAIGGIISNLKLDITFGELNESHIKETTQKIEKLILHLSHTIDDFSKFYREEDENQFEKIEISKIIDESLNIIIASIKNNNIDLQLDIKNNEVIYIMPNRLKQVILNLIKNSLDALKEREIKNPYIKIEVFKNDNLIIEIKDNAGGIDESIIDKVFEPYFTTKDEKNGTGIGLYMSKMIIERMGGKLMVENDTDGAKFSIELKEINAN